MTGQPVPWTQRRWLAFDIEATGLDVERDLILSAAMVWVEPDGNALESYDLIDWDVPIPPESTKVHGLTREMLAKDGGKPAEVLDVLVNALHDQMSLQIAPVVGMNLAYDLTMLDRNCRRAGVTPLQERCEVSPVIDVFVLDKYVDPYRRGKRNLEALSKHYRVQWPGEAHNALADARVSARVAWRISRIWPAVGAMDPNLLHAVQAKEKQAQDASYRRHLLQNNKDASGVDGAWPMRPWGGVQ